MFIKRKQIGIFAVSLALLAQPLAAKTLRDVKSVDDALFQISLAYSIQKHCGSYRPRLFRAIAFRNRVVSDARSHGFTDRQIEDHVDSKVEQARMQVLVDDYLVTAGYEAGSTTGYCAVGAQEVAASTPAGRLLR